jgi:hypothetical protein
MGQGRGQHIPGTWTQILQPRKELVAVAKEDSWLTVFGEEVRMTALVGISEEKVPGNTTRR